MLKAKMKTPVVFKKVKRNTCMCGIGNRQRLVSFTADIY